ncbi:hypothetical protein GCM10009601_51150 [Streptomyces thermospinosisporus]|uniref:Uncharacterized protein n=1 Tax=Streptomyces thermospinosisporus TaxID=161482 RepID=A0ABN1Z648_9ACTN
MSEIEFTANLGGRAVVASVLDPTSDHVVPDERGCPDCEQPAYFSGCDAPGCNGWGCQNCGSGCDLDFCDEDESRCAQAIAERDEDDEEAEDEA